MQENVRLVRIEDEVRSSYLDYAMSVIVARALPDVRDGLKPVQRRILYAMDELGLTATSAYKKSARIVGEVLGKYHPHGDVAVYEAMVRMAQDFSLRYRLVNGQGNFGSVDNDPPAAMRYTEARLTAIALEMLADIDRDTVDFAPNFDGTLKEPLVLPARVPNLLLNGASGIAVGMATNIPPHNLTELSDALTHLVDHPEAPAEELLRLVSGPDFPTGGIIRGRKGIEEAYATGKGRIVLEARAVIEEASKGRSQIVITEIPYETSKASLVERMATLSRERKIEGIAEVRDESDREGMRVVVELKKEAQPQKVLNNLFKYTALRGAFHVNMLALVDGQPQVLTLKALLTHYIEFRRQVIVRRAQFDLTRARERLHILEGFKIALDALDAVIATIRRSPSAEAAREALMTGFNLSQAQAQAILELQLRRLAALERQKILDEHAEVTRTIAELEALLASPTRVDQTIKDEIAQVRGKYGDARRTEIFAEEATEYGAEDLIPHQEMVVTVSKRGYAKRVPVEVYRLQRRGGRGIMGMVTRDTDAVQHLVVADTHDRLLFFSDRGRVYHLNCHELTPDLTRTAKGQPLVNHVSLEPDEEITALVGTPGFSPGQFLVLATRRGAIKRTPLEEFSPSRGRSGLIAMALKPDDTLIAAILAREGDEVLAVTRKGKAARFRVSAIQSHARSSGGVRSIRLAPGDQVVTVELVRPDGFLLTVTEKGFGKVTRLGLFRTLGRGAQGVGAFNITPKTGDLMQARVVTLPCEVMLASQEGIVIRLPVEGISKQGRLTQGVSIMKLDEGDQVASVACFSNPQDAERDAGV